MPRRVILIEGHSFVFEIVPEAEQPRYNDMSREEIEAAFDWSDRSAGPPRLSERALEKIIARLRERGHRVEEP